jgi:tape measure domain-containing protein
MASAELIVAFGAKIDGLEASLKRVTTKFGELERSAATTSTKIESSLEGANSSLAAMATNIRQAAAAFGVMKAFQIGRDLALQIDDVNQSLVRMRFLLNNDPSAARKQFEDLAQISRRTGTGISDLTDQFVRFRVALNSIGATNQQVNQLVETLANFARVSGSRPQEAINAIVQLGQGLASGKLGGEELRSVLENTPLLAQELARELGVTVGELRKMGEEGRLVASNVFPALLRAGERIKEMLKDMPLGLRQNIEVAKTAWTQLIEHIDQKVGASAGIAAMIRVLTAGMDAVRTATGGETSEEKLARIDREIAAAQARVSEVRSQLDAGIIRGARAPGGAVLQDQPIDARQRRALEAEIAGHQQRITRLVEEGVTARTELETTADRQGVAATLEGMRQRRSQAEADNRNQIEDLDRRARLRREAEKAIEDARRIAQENALRDAYGRVQTFAQREAQIRQKLAEDIAAIDRAESAQSREEAARRDRERLQRERQTAEALARFRRLDENPLRNMQDSFASLSTPEPGSTVGSAMDVMYRAIAARTEQMSTLYGALTTEATRAGEAMVRAGRDPQPVIDALNAKFDEVGTKLRELGLPDNEITAARNEAFASLERNLDRVREKAESTWMDIGSRAAKTFSSDLASGIVEFATTSENKFDEMAANFVKNIAKMILEFLILRAVVTGLQAVGINLPGFNFGGPVKAPGRMSGGPVTAGSAYVVGERRRELFVPGSSGYIYPEVGGGGDMTVNVYNSSGANVRTNETTDSQGGRVLEVYIENIVRQGLSSGRFDGAMRQNYNLTRPGRV